MTTEKFNNAARYVFAAFCVAAAGALFSKANTEPTEAPAKPQADTHASQAPAPVAPAASAALR